MICSLAYKILEYDIIRIETKETINLENGNLVSSDNTQKLKQNRHVTKSKRYNNLRRAFIKTSTSKGLVSCSDIYVERVLR